jgi:hypothetical protein
MWRKFIIVAYNNNNKRECKEGMIPTGIFEKFELISFVRRARHA